MENKLQDEVEKCFLNNNDNFHVLSSIFDSENFGNSIIEFVYNDLQIKLIIDRGDLFCDVKAHIDTGEYKSLEFVLNKLYKGHFIKPTVKNVLQTSKIIKKQELAIYEIVLGN